MVIIYIWTRVYIDVCMNIDYHKSAGKGISEQHKAIHINKERQEFHRSESLILIYKVSEDKWKGEKHKFVYA